MIVDLDPDTERLIVNELQTGRSQRAEEFIRRAVKHFLIARELGEEYTPEEIEAKIARGISSLENGDGVDGEQFLDTLEAELDAAEKAHKAG
ncbi:MAG: type II toxin-antitoxin system ParD family antitoxin [Acidobacteria bacterium]|nr:type II toxin-antitoxin system ParD family antitoxin [Acidobacteriota bacterium]MBI3473221.1 type II toxin-antitoxin system ParD family antitoxin [Candidatus Solibacter usitatus]